MTDNASLTRIRLNGNTQVAGSSSASAEASMLGRADRLAGVGQLAAGLAHEMNTPLGSISAHAEESLDLLDNLRSGQLTREELNDIRGRLLAIMRQANRCSRIATRLLQFAQPATSTRERSRPDQVISEVIDLFRPTAEQMGIVLKGLTRDSLPETPIGPAELEQLLVNLMQNSIDACRPGDTIGVQASATSESICLIVSDTGCGIPPETLPRIFDPFFTTKPVGHGTGLGLSACHGIVRGVGGSIEVESVLGQGTRVTVLLPRRPR